MSPRPVQTPAVRGACSERPDEAALLAQWGTVMKEDLKAAARSQFGACHRRQQKLQQIFRPRRFTMTPDTAPDSLPFQQTLRLCLKTTFAYRMPLPSTEDKIRILEERYARCKRVEWSDDVYNCWSELVPKSYAFDGRYVLGLIRLAEGSLAHDVEALKDEHAKLCDRVEARLAMTCEDDEYHVENLNLRCLREDMVLMPTTRAIFVMMSVYATDLDKEEDSVLLVLTGDDSRMVSKAPSFDTITSSILSWDSDSRPCKAGSSRQVCCCTGGSRGSLQQADAAGDCAPHTILRESTQR